MVLSNTGVVQFSGLSTQDAARGQVGTRRAGGGHGSILVRLERGRRLKRQRGGKDLKCILEIKLVGLVGCGERETL